MPNNKAIGTLVRLKDTFDRSLEKLLFDLSEINMDNVSGFIPSPTVEERTRIDIYFRVLQIEIVNKTTQLARFQQSINDRVTHVLKSNNYDILQDEIVDADQEEEDARYLPNTKFLPERWSKSPITMKTDSITAQHLKELREYLLSGGNFSTH